MSKRSKQRRAQAAMAEAKRAETAKTETVDLQGVTKVGNRPSVAQIVLTKMGTMGLIKTEEKPAAPVKPTVHIPSTNKERWPESWPKCPASCDPVEWRRALEAKEHYELKALEGEERGEKKPWFQHPKHSYQYSEFVFVTPEMADELLAHNPLNRKVKASHVNSISRDVTNDRWLQTHESIAINRLGDMQDGQHRAKGIKTANKGWPIYITWNVPPESIFVVDSGQKRNINDKLNLLFPESRISNKTAALCRAMMAGLKNRDIRFSESEIAEFAEKYYNVIQLVFKHVSKYRADLQAVIGKGYLWYGEEVVTPFVQKLNTLSFSSDNDPAKTLYLWLVKVKGKGRTSGYTNPVVYYKKTLSALVAHASGRDSKILFQKQDDLFNWLPGWEVPENTPKDKPKEN